MYIIKEDRRYKSNKVDFKQIINNCKSIVKNTKFNFQIYKSPKNVRI